MNAAAKRTFLTDRMLLAAVVALVCAALGNCAPAPPSSVECLSDVTDLEQLCVLKNVAIWGGQIFIVQEENLDLPELLLSNVGQYLHTNYTGPELSRYVRQVSAHNAPFTHVEKTSHHQYAVLHQASLLSNHGHNMLETIPALYNRVCSFLGLCHYEDAHFRGQGGLLILWLDGLTGALPAMEFLINCFASRNLDMNSTPSTEVIYVQELLVGFPTPKSCVGQHLCHRHNNYSDVGVTSRRVQFMRQCVGLPASSDHDRQSPHVLFINRNHAAGRSILTSAEAMQTLQSRHWGTAAPSFELSYLDTLNLTDQACLMDAADVFVLPHGAALGNLAFASRHSVMIHVFWGEGHRLDNEWQAKRLDQVLNISTIPLRVPQTGGLDPVTSKVMQSEAVLQKWSAQQLLDFLARGTCPITETDFCRDYNWASKYYNYAVPVSDLVSKVTEAIDLWTQINAGSRHFVRYPKDQLQRGHHQLN